MPNVLLGLLTSARLLPILRLDELSYEFAPIRYVHNQGIIESLVWWQKQTSSKPPFKDPSLYIMYQVDLLELKKQTSSQASFITRHFFLLSVSDARHATGACESDCIMSVITVPTRRVPVAIGSLDAEIVQLLC